MAKRGKLTEEEILQNSINYDIQDTEKRIRYAGEPSYIFNVGDKVRLGNLRNCVVDKVLYGGRAYGVNCVRRDANYGNPIDYNWYRVVPWVDLRPINEETESLARNKDIRFDIRNYHISNIISTYYFFGINMNPKYQRGYEWTQEDRELLIDSIFSNIDIGKIALVHKNHEYYTETGFTYEILDGKQRVKAIIDFYENRFPYRGKYYNDLSLEDQLEFKEFPLGTAILDNPSDELVLRSFIMLNTTGKSIDKEHINKIKEQLANLK